MNNFTDALAAIGRLKSEGVVKDYAIGGSVDRELLDAVLARYQLRLTTYERDDG